VGAGAEFDVLVIGGGPAGYVAALRAAQLGLKTALAEKEKLGGVCLNKGCIPSKTLLAATELAAKLEKASEWGLEVPGAASWNLKKLFEKKESVVSQLRKGIETLVQKRKIVLLAGEARLTAPGKIQVGTETVSAKKVILATGSSARRLDIGVKNPKLVWTSEEALSPERVPGSLLIL
jgi:dihydrolipoamide dehydrogenase